MPSGEAPKPHLLPPEQPSLRLHLCQPGTFIPQADSTSPCASLEAHNLPESNRKEDEALEMGCEMIPAPGSSDSRKRESLKLDENFKLLHIDHMFEH